MRQTAAWLILFIIGLVLIDIGITGSLGKVLAVVFAPGLLETTSSGSTSGGTFTPAFPGKTTFPGGAQAPTNVPNL
jgi:hypothetical protein